MGGVLRPLEAAVVVPAHQLRSPWAVRLDMVRVRVRSRDGLVGEVVDNRRCRCSPFLFVIPTASEMLRRVREKVQVLLHKRAQGSRRSVG